MTSHILNWALIGMGLYIMPRTLYWAFQVRVAEVRRNPSSTMISSSNIIKLLGVFSVGFASGLWGILRSTAILMTNPETYGLYILIPAVVGITLALIASHIEQERTRQRQRRELAATTQSLPD